MKRWRKDGRGDAPSAGSAGDAAPPASEVAASADPAVQAPASPTAPEGPVLPSLALPWPPLVDGPNQVSLRPWGAAPSDAATLARAWVDPDIARWTAVPEAHDVAAAARWIAGDEAKRASGRALDLVIAEFGGSDVVHGEVGLVVVEPERGWAEVGYWLLPEARGAGRASIAVGLFAQWALHALPITRLFARTDPANPAAAAVVERAGFTSVGTIDDGPHVWARDA